MNLRRIRDDLDFSLQPVSQDTYDVVKSGQSVYRITKSGQNWSCSCPGFSFRGKCKHVDELNKELAEDDTAPVKPGRHPRAELERFIPELEEICSPFDTWELVGSWRRKLPTFKDADVIALASPSEWNQVHQNLLDSGSYEEYVFGDTLMRGLYHGYYLDFNLCPSKDDWLWWLIYRTGDAEENKAMRYRAISMGYTISEKGVFDRYTFDKVEGINSEEEFYNFFGYEYRRPEIRNGKNFRQLPGWRIEEHYSEGKQALDDDDVVDWGVYLLTSIEKLRGSNTVYRGAHYPARLAIIVARELARRTGKTPEFYLSKISPEEIQPEGFKRGQQSWDEDGNIFRVE
jgi:hypothetical protein